MEQARTSKHKRNALAYACTLALWLLLMAITFSQENTQAQARFDLSPLGLHLLQTVFSLPTLFIWLALVFATLSFYRYAKQIAGYQESAAFRYIAYALAITLAGSIISMFMSQYRTFLLQSAASDLTVRIVIKLGNYVSVAVALVSYWFLFSAARTLLDSIKKPLNNARILPKISLPVALVTASYVYLILANPYRTVSDNPNITPTYAMPDSRIFLTVVLPYAISWALGFMALTGFYLYQIKTSGIVYKKLLKKLTIGVSMLIVMTIVLQFVTQLSRWLAGAGLSAILTLIFVIYLILIVAYFLVAQGARQLNKIETLDV